MEKVRDILELYLAPPERALVLCIDEKSQIQALDRTQPGLSLQPNKCGAMTHDYKRHRVTTLSVTFNVRDGAVLSRCMAQHRHQEFVRFLNVAERAAAPGKLIRAVADKCAKHEYLKVRAWLKRHPRWVLTSPRPRRPGPRHRGLLLHPDPTTLEVTRVPVCRRPRQAIACHIREHNAGSGLFVRTKPADTILGKLSRKPAPSV